MPSGLRQRGDSLWHLPGRHLLRLGHWVLAQRVHQVRYHHLNSVVTAAIGLDHVSYDDSINHVVYPLLDSKSEQITTFFNEFYSHMELWLAKGNVLVHCAAGISRVNCTLRSLQLWLYPIWWKDIPGPSRKPSTTSERSERRFAQIWVSKDSWRNIRGTCWAKPLVCHGDRPPRQASAGNIMWITIIDFCQNWGWATAIEKDRSPINIFSKTHYFRIASPKLWSPKPGKGEISTPGNVSFALCRKFYKEEGRNGSLFGPQEQLLIQQSGFFSQPQRKEFRN